MGLLSSLKFSSKSADKAGTTMPDATEIASEARAAARRRLIGATVMLGIGIIGFPLLFESRPRPIPVDIPIEIPAREGVTPLQQPVAKVDARRPETMPAHPIDEPVLTEPSASSGSGPAKTAATAALATAGVAAVAKLSDKPAAASKPVATTPPAAKPEPKPAPKPEPKLEPKPEPKPAPKPEPKPEPKPAAKPEPRPEAKAAAKPEPKPAPKTEAKPDPKTAAKPVADEGRYVVQIGAFAEVTGAREARMKVEGMGLKTYTQVIESATGRRIRVRVGPYATKAEADKAAARIKSGGLQAAVLVL